MSRAKVYDFDLLNFCSIIIQRHSSSHISVLWVFPHQSNASLGSKDHSYSTEVIASSPKVEIENAVKTSRLPHLRCHPRPLPPRVAAMLKILVRYSPLRFTVPL